MSGEVSDTTRHPRSTARIAGHPIHPMLVPFPIVGFVGAFLADIMFVRTAGRGWATALIWLLGVGLIFAVLAALAGLADYFGTELVFRHGAGVADRHVSG